MTRVMPKLRFTLESVGASLLLGITLGVGLILAELNDYAVVPHWVGYLMMLVAGVLLGLLIHDFARALATYLLVLLMGAIVSVLALSFPEFYLDQLGTQTAVEVSIVNTVQKTFLLGLPISMTGLLLGKVIHRS